MTLRYLTDIEESQFEEEEEQTALVGEVISVKDGVAFVTGLPTLG